MRLLSMTVKNFRSITRSSRFALSDFSVLLGPNNEGKSNILRALRLAMTTVLATRRAAWSRYESPRSREAAYDWERDFPVQLQNSTPKGHSEFLLEFELSPDEENAFFTAVGSRVRSPLPIEVLMGPEGVPTVSVRKRGPGSAKVTEKRERISEFLAQRLDFDYIPAVRTAESAQRVVQQMVERELATLEDNPEYQQALAGIEALQKPILSSISAVLRDTLKQFLPNVTSVEVDISSERRHEALRRAEIYVNDGVPTELRYKGDGAQSLAALALMRRGASAGTGSKHVVLALEEPESHLHPQGIHELRTVLRQLALNQQVVLTTHCPLFVDRHSIERNIVVRRGRANPAKSLDEIRSVLGVRAADNLRHADLVLVVEGEDDRTALIAILKNRSSALRSALQANRLAIDTIGGAGKLTYKLGLLRDAICPYVCFMDGDEAGESAVKDAIESGYLSRAQGLLAKLSHRETEFEDLLDDAFVEALLLKEFGVGWRSPPKKFAPRKWSDRAAEVFRMVGQPWDEAAVKLAVARAVASNPATAVRASTSGPIDNLVVVLERTLAGELAETTTELIPEKSEQAATSE